MKRTLFSSYQGGLLASTDLVRSRPGSRSLRLVVPPEPVVTIDVGDPREVVDAGWRAWAPDTPKVA